MNTTKMERMIENYMNGNLTEAKRKAKTFHAWQIREALREAGYSMNKAALTADWLHGRDCWQEACDAE